MIVVLHITPEDATELGDAGERPAVRHLGFQRVEERFDMGVLIGRAPTRHALLDAAPGQAIAKRRPEKFAAAIAMEDEAGLRPSTLECGMHDGAREGSIARRRHTPSQDATRVLVQDGSEIPPPVQDLEIREVADPDLVARAGLQSMHAVGMLAEPAMGAGRPAIHAHRPCAPPAQPHQAFDPSMTEAMAARRQRPIEARTAIGLDHPPLAGCSGRLARHSAHTTSSPYRSPPKKQTEGVNASQDTLDGIWDERGVS